MPYSDIENEYKRLRSELENAYAAPVWDSKWIDTIANAIARIEQASMRAPMRAILRPRGPHPEDAAPRGHGVAADFRSGT